MIQKMKLSRFWRLSFGLLLLGIGQRLIYTGAVAPWARDRGLPIILLILSLVALCLGLVLILPLVVWFYKRHRSDKRLPKLILAYLLSAAVAGLMIGGIGQFLYDHTSFSYSSVKTGIWAFSIIIQTILKVILCYNLVCIYRQLSIRQGKQLLGLPLILAIGGTGMALGLSSWIPMMASVFLSVTDATILIATFYYFLYKEKIYETAS